MGRRGGDRELCRPREEKQTSQGREASGEADAINTFQQMLRLLNKEAVSLSTALTKYSQLTSWVVQGWELLAHIQLNFKCQSSLAVILAKDSL